MVAVRVVRNLLPLVLVAVLAAACGSGSSSGSSSAPLELRPVYARLGSGPQLGPQVPKALQSAMSNQSCPMAPTELQGMVMECDPGKTVYLLQDPIVSGGVTKAAVEQIGHKNLYFLRLTLDPTAAAALDSQAQSMTGTELAFCFGGSVLTSVIVDPHFSAERLTITGSYTKAQATKLAGQITAS
jgi:preprotein translocase subunit SecD